MTEATQSLLPVTPELLPCPNPWCESHKYGQEGAPTRDDVMWLSGTESRIVGCAYCNLQGPIGKGEDEAIALWNTRSQSHSLPGDVETLALVAAPNALGSDGPAIAAQLREISRISNKYDLRECIEGHDDALGDSYIWRDLMDHCEKLGSKGSALSGDAGEGDRSIADDLRYLEEAEAHADEGPLGEPAARSILKIALRLARKANDTGNPIAPGCPRASRLHAPLRFCPDCPEGDSCELPAQQGGR